MSDSNTLSRTLALGRPNPLSEVLMFNHHALADRAGAILFEKAELRMNALLAEHGVSDPKELPPATAFEIFQRAVIETAAATFPTANVEMLTHGFRSFAHPAFSPAYERVVSWAAGPGDPFGAAKERLNKGWN
jgi:hypothetical protein